MSRTAESYIDKPRKFAHDLCKGIAVFFGVLALLALIAGAGGNFLLFLLICGGFARAASKIKYVWMKQVEMSNYKLV